MGDQSAGKSSLLQSITGIPFPKGEFLVTRYATQITSRRANKVSIAISILPGVSASDEHKAHLETYKQALKSASELAEQFQDILTTVSPPLDLLLSLLLIMD